jgi:predicted transposase YdaD
MPTSGKPFDAAAKELVELDPVAWLKYVHISVPAPASVTVIDSDASTVTAQADKVLRIDEDPPWIVHVELQAARDTRLAERILRYNVLLSYRHEMMVRSTVVLLRKEAEGPRLIGTYEQRFSGEDPHLTFRYDVVRAWEQRAEDILAGGLATLPLLAVADVRGMGIEEALAAMAARLANETTADRRALLIASTRLLMGLAYKDDEADRIFRRIEMLDVLKIHGIEESSTYQAIFREGKAEGKAEGELIGKAEEAREILLRLGRKKFGNPKQRILGQVATEQDLNRLGELLDRILDAKSWDDLLAPES